LRELGYRCKLAAHEAAVGIAASQQVSMLVFLALTLTGYKPDLAETLMCAADDEPCLASRTRDSMWTR
jgi:hypothetical protein